MIHCNINDHLFHCDIYMFSKNENVLPKEKIASNLKEILIDIRLLQRTCQMIDHDFMRPPKFSHLSLSEAQSKQKSLIPLMRNLASQLSDEEFDDVVNSADKEASVIIEMTPVAPSFSFK